MEQTNRRKRGKNYALDAPIAKEGWRGGGEAVVVYLTNQNALGAQDAVNAFVLQAWPAKLSPLPEIVFYTSNKL